MADADAAFAAMLDLSDPDDSNDDDDDRLDSSEDDEDDVRWSMNDDDEAEEIAERISRVVPSSSANPLLPLPPDEDLLGVGTCTTWDAQQQQQQQPHKPAANSSSSDFSPQGYLADVHAGTGLESLHRGIANLERGLEKLNTARMALVKDNFERFIKCKNTIDDVRLKLQQNELDRSAEAANTELLREALVAAREEALAVFEPLIERQRKAARLLSLQSTFREHRFFFEMPGVLRELMHEDGREGDVECGMRVISCYRKACALMRVRESQRLRSRLFDATFHAIERAVAEHRVDLRRRAEAEGVSFLRRAELQRTLALLDNVTKEWRRPGGAYPFASSPKERTQRT